MDSIQQSARTSKNEEVHQNKTETYGDADFGFDSGLSDSEMAEARLEPTDYNSQYNYPVSTWQLNIITADVATDWKSLALYLHMKINVVNNIEADCLKVEDKTREMLIKWSQENGKAATLLKLAKALAKCKRTDVIEILTGDAKFAQELKEEGNSITLNLEGQVESNIPGLEVQYGQDPVTGERYVLMKDNGKLPKGVQIGDFQKYMCEGCGLKGLTRIDQSYCSALNESSKLEDLRQAIKRILHDQREHIQSLSSWLKSQGNGLSKCYDSLSEHCGQLAKSQCTLLYDKQLDELNELFDTIKICELFFEAELKKIASLHSPQYQTECQEFKELEEGIKDREIRRRLVRYQLLELSGHNMSDDAPSHHSMPPKKPSDRPSIFKTMKRTLTEGSESLRAKLNIMNPFQKEYEFQEIEDGWVTIKKEEEQQGITGTKVTQINPDIE